MERTGEGVGLSIFFVRKRAKNRQAKGFYASIIRDSDILNVE